MVDHPNKIISIIEFKLLDLQLKWEAMEDSFIPSDKLTLAT